MKHLLILAILFFTNSLYADNGTNQPPEQGFSQTLIMVAIAILFFYLILWRPEQKRRKAQEALRTGIKKGDRVTAMGIIGTVYRVQDQTVIVTMYDGSKVEFLKAAISEVLPKDDEEEKKEKKENINNSKKIDISEME